MTASAPPIARHSTCGVWDTPTRTHQCGNGSEHTGQHRCGACGETWFN